MERGKRGGSGDTLHYRLCIPRLPRSSKGESACQNNICQIFFVYDVHITNLSEKYFGGRGLDRGWWNRGVMWITSSSLPRLPCRTIYLLRRIYVGTKVKLVCISARAQAPWLLGQMYSRPHARLEYQVPRFQAGTIPQTSYTAFYAILWPATWDFLTLQSTTVFLIFSGESFLDRNYSATVYLMWTCCALTFSPFIQVSIFPEPALSGSRLM